MSDDKKDDDLKDLMEAVNADFGRVVKSDKAQEALRESPIRTLVLEMEENEHTDKLTDEQKAELAEAMMENGVLDAILAGDQSGVYTHTLEDGTTFDQGWSLVDRTDFGDGAHGTIH